MSTYEEVLHTLRAELGFAKEMRQFTMEQIAQESELSVPTVNRIFNHTEKVRVDSLIRLCNALGVSIHLTA